MQSRRVLLDGRFLDLKLNTGISRYVEWLISFYVEVDDVSLTLVLKERVERYQHVDIYILNSDVLSLSGGLRLSFLCLLRRFDIIHLPFYFGLFFKPRQSKVVLTFHDLMYNVEPSFFKGSRLANRFKIRTLNYTIGNSLRLADVVLSVSRTTARDVERIFGRSSEVVPEVISFNNLLFGSDRNDELLDFDKYFLYCGSARPHKNCDLILDYFKENLRDEKLVVVGPGHKLKVGSNNDGAIWYLGVVSDLDLQRLYRGAIAIIFPSFYEGFGLPVLEALSLGTNVVASRIDAFLEFSDSKNIHYFSPTCSECLTEALNWAINRDFLDDSVFLQRFSREEVNLKLRNVFSMYEL